jgi:hypothetical protein
MNNSIERNFKIPSLEASMVYKYNIAGKGFPSRHFSYNNNRNSVLTINEKVYNGEFKQCLETEQFIKTCKGARKEGGSANIFFCLVGNKNIVTKLNSDYQKDPVNLSSEIKKAIINKDVRECTDNIVCVTFDRTYQEYNVFGSVEGYSGQGYLYIKAGYYLKESKKEKETSETITTISDENGNEFVLNDSICISNGKLIAIVISYSKDKPKKNEEKTADVSEEEVAEETVDVSENEGESIKATRVSENRLDEVADCPDYFQYDSQKKQYYKYGNIKTLKKTKDLRKELYNNGFDLGYDDEKKGEHFKAHYVRYKRSAGMSREGKCFFIREELLNKMEKWSSFRDNKLLKEYKLKPGNDVVSDEAYKALSLSSIIGTVEIPLDSILFVNDKISSFKDTVISIKKDESGQKLVGEEKEINAENNIWDGEALLDKSVFESAGFPQKGMMLLRNRYFKSCAFNTNLQKWFTDNNITSVDQLNGFTMSESISDIKMIVTDSSLKFLKVLDSENKENKIKYWIDALSSDNGKIFGIVKTEKPTAYLDGKLVRTSYQVLNTIGFSENSAEQFLEPMTELKSKIRKDPSYMALYLEKMCNVGSDNGFEKEDDDNENENDITSLLYSPGRYKEELILSLLKGKTKISDSKFYRKFISKIVIPEINSNLRRGKLLMSGTYAVLFGNGYELLKYSIDKEYEPDKDSSRPLNGNQIYIKGNGFSDGEDLICARSPHITMGNLLLAKNCYSKEYDEYFNLTEQIVCINAVGFNIQQMLNGCDYDSDTMLISNDKIAIETAQKYSADFLVPYTDISPDSKVQKKEDLDKIDQAIAVNKIGEIVNSSQKLNSLYWTIRNIEELRESWKNYLEDARSNLKDLPHIVDKVEEMDESTLENAIKNGTLWLKNYDESELYKYICELASLSGMEIDKAKRDYGISVDKILEEIDNEYNLRAKLIGETKHKQEDLDIQKTLDEPKEVSDLFGIPGYPRFWKSIGIVRKGVPKDIKRKEIIACPMSYIYSYAGKKDDKRYYSKSLCELVSISNNNSIDKEKKSIRNIIKMAEETAADIERENKKRQNEKEKRKKIKRSATSIESSYSRISRKLKDTFEEIQKYCKTENEVLTLLKEIDNSIKSQEEKGENNTTEREWILFAGLCFNPSKGNFDYSDDCLIYKLLHSDEKKYELKDVSKEVYDIFTRK